MIEAEPILKGPNKTQREEKRAKLYQTRMVNSKNRNKYRFQYAKAR